MAAMETRKEEENNASIINMKKNRKKGEIAGFSAKEVRKEGIKKCLEDCVCRQCGSNLSTTHKGR